MTWVFLPCPHIFLSCGPQETDARIFLASAVGGDYFLQSLREEFVQNARLFIFETVWIVFLQHLPVSLNRYNAIRARRTFVCLANDVQPCSSDKNLIILEWDCSMNVITLHDV